LTSGIKLSPPNPVTGQLTFPGADGNVSDGDTQASALAGSGVAIRIITNIAKHLDEGAAGSVSAGFRLASFQVFARFEKYPLPNLIDPFWR
jgi:hypothetical protein